MLTVLFYSSLTFTSFAQTHTSPKWQSGKGSAQGTNLAEMKLNALNSARSDALKKAGLFIRSVDVSMKSESQSTFTDFFAAFGETYTRGLILDEKNLKVSPPIPLQDSIDILNSTYRIEVSIDALIAIQEGEPDPEFTVTLSTNRDMFAIDDPVIFNLTTTRDGYLTLFSIWNDSLSVVFPNSIERNNFIRSGEPFIFPPPAANYHLNLKPPAGLNKSSEIFIAIVSIKNIPFSSVIDEQYEGNYLKLRQAMLTNYAKWLYKIPIQDRAADTKVVTILRK